MVEDTTTMAFESLGGNDMAAQREAINGILPFDPNELKDTVSGNIVNPYPRYEELRRESPVHVGAVDFGEGASDLNPDVPLPITVVGFDETVAVLRDNGLYSSCVYEIVTEAVMGRTILQMDEPEHREHRALVSPTFRSKVLARWEEELVRGIVDDLIDSFIDKGHVDLVQAITFNFPVQVIARILGLPQQDYPSFQQWAIELNSVAANWERGMAASAALRDYFAAVLDERRKNPADDLISELVHVELDGQRLDDEEIYSFLRLLLPAGVETTYRASGNLLFGLLTHPDQLNAVREDRSLIPQAFEESLRWEPPVAVVLRRAMESTELAGVPIEGGADVALMLGGANRDHRKYENPDEFNIFRKERQHVGFGFGVHVCMGMHLARMETRIALEAILDRLDDLKLDPAPGQDIRIEGLAFRSPVSLPVSFTAR